MGWEGRVFCLLYYFFFKPLYSDFLKLAYPQRRREGDELLANYPVRHMAAITIHQIQFC